MSTLESLSAEIARKDSIIEAMSAELVSARAELAEAERRRECDTRLLAQCVELLDLPLSVVSRMAGVAA